MTPNRPRPSTEPCRQLPALREAAPRGRMAWPALLVVAALCSWGWWDGASGPPAVPPDRVAAAPAPASDPAAPPTRSPLPTAPAAPTAAAEAAAPVPARLPRLATFGDETPPPDVRHVAHWALDSGDHQGKSFVIVDKKQAKVWLFDPTGALIGATPALIGSAIGDDAVPGIGEKPLAEILPHEKTTPAGRYVAEPGENAKGEDIIWVSYDLAVSLHRVRPTVKSERRLERLASATPEDNRISFGCINLPVSYYETVLRPVVLATGAIVYVLPETRSPREQFGSYDVPEPAVVAHAGSPAVK